jgi:hypothetical protein
MTRTLSVCLFLACTGGAALAQDISGTIQGSILDPTNAPVPHAKVSIKLIDRNQVVRTITTDAGGDYSAPLIPIGNYSIKVEATGFKTEERTDIVLNVNDDLKINITLQVGAITETVEVKSQTALVELGTPANTTTIEGVQVRELTLNTRNYEQLVSLMPGVSANTTDELYIGNSAPSGFAATLPYSINGMRNSANNWTVDGTDNVDRGSNQTLMTFPSVDAISEFKVERSLYTADTGRAGGAQINVVTKSGSSAFHGSLYEFFRNDYLAANNWANNANKVNVVNGVAKVPPLRWNDFGGTFGGPVYIPNHYNKDKNKTFFFFSEEARRIHTYTTLSPTIPTQGMLSGQFPQPVCISYTTSCQQTATTIPANLINANSAAYIKDIFSKLPLSTANTVAGTTAGLFPVQNIYNSRQEIARVDHTFNEKFTVWGRFENDVIPTTEPGGLFTGSAIPYVATTNTNSPGRSFSVHVDNILRPSLLNDAGFNYSQSAINSVPVGLTSKANDPDINPAEPFANTQGVTPELAFTSGSSLLGYGPYNEYNKNFAWFDSLTWIKGRHTMKFGGSFNRYNKTENAANQEGTFSFTTTGIPTGTSSFMQSWANFLLGNVSSFSMPSMDVTPDLWAWQHEAYAQDDFKVSPRLTFSMGVRWSFFGQPSDSHGILDNFDPALYLAANAPKIDPTTGNIIAGTGSSPSTNGIIVGGKNSPFGEKIAPNKYDDFAPRVGLAWDPFGKGTTSIRAGYGLYYDSTLFGGYEQNSFANPPFVSSVAYSNGNFSNIASGTLGVSLSPLVLHATQLPADVPYSQQWSFDIQHQFVKDVVLDVAYVGTKGTHLLGYVDINEAPPGAALAAGLHTANGNTIFTSTDDPRINAIRPYLGFNAINTIESAFDSNYNSLQAMVRKTVRGGGILGASYTYSKALTDNSSDRSNAPQNSYNWHEGEYGPAAFDRKQIFTANYVYPLPFLMNRRNVAGYILGGWQLSGVVSASSGLPSTVTTSSVDPAGLGLLGSSAASARPDMVCDPNANAPHQYNGIAAAGEPLWFNTACFQPVPQGTVRPGNAGRYTVRGPGYFNWDMAAMKFIPFGERVKMELRAEAYNGLNWVNPSGFASTNNTSTVFGEVTTFRDARRMQIAAKLTF